MTGEDIRKIRGVMGMTLTEFAEKLGINDKYLSRIETGRDEVSLKMQTKVFIQIVDTLEYRQHLRRLQELCNNDVANTVSER